MFSEINQHNHDRWMPKFGLKYLDTMSVMHHNHHSRFIGGNFVLDWIAGSDEPVVNLDKLTYAGNLETLASLQDDARHTFVRGMIWATAPWWTLCGKPRGGQGC